MLVDEYHEVTELLEVIERRLFLRNVFVSGSAHQFGGCGEDRMRDFCMHLGERLIEGDMRQDVLDARNSDGAPASLAMRPWEQVRECRVGAPAGPTAGLAAPPTSSSVLSRAVARARNPKGQLYHASGLCPDRRNPLTGGGRRIEECIRLREAHLKGRNP